MFKSVTARYALRCVLVGVAALVTALQAGQGLTEAVLAAAAAAIAYAGIGAIVPAVEPSIGKKLGP